MAVVGKQGIAALRLEGAGSTCACCIVPTVIQTGFYRLLWFWLQVPYGTSFHQNVQWACRYEGRGKCRLRVTGEVEFTKSPFVKGMIQKASEEVCLGALLALLLRCALPNPFVPLPPLTPT